MIIREAVTITTIADGTASGSIGPLTGYVHALRYVPHSTTPFDTGADITVTGAVSGIAILTLTNLGTAAITIMPRAATTLVANTGNAAEVYASSDSVNDRVPVCEEKINFAVAQGGDTKTGTFYVYVD